MSSPNIHINIYLTEPMSDTTIEEFNFLDNLNRSREKQE